MGPLTLGPVNYTYKNALQTLQHSRNQIKMSRTTLAAALTNPHTKSNNMIRIFSSKLPLKNYHLPTRITCSILLIPNQFTRHPSSHNNNNQIKDIHFNNSNIIITNIRRSCVMSQNNDDGVTLPQQSHKTVRCVIKGRVQGVFYRNWTIENATQLGLKGWVRNKRDGSVEALFSGKPEAVNEMMQRCRRGPPDAMVTAFEAYPSTDDPGDGFQRRPTV